MSTLIADTVEASLRAASSVSSWTEDLAAIQTLVVTVSLVALVYQIWSDHRRRRREATVTYMNEISKVYRGIDYDLSRGLEIDEDTVESIETDPTLYKSALDLFARFEHLAAGVHQDVFDIKLLNKMAGGYFLDVYARWRRYLNYQIHKSANPQRYDQFERLIVRLAVMRNAEPPVALERTGFK